MVHLSADNKVLAVEFTDEEGEQLGLVAIEDGKPRMLNLGR